MQRKENHNEHNVMQLKIKAWEKRLEPKFGSLKKTNQIIKSLEMIKIKRMKIKYT